MHMADALLSPAVGGGMWALSAGLIGYCSKVLRTTLDDWKIPLMGVVSAFVFAAQMVNFSIPATGSSGHLGGGLLLAILLGPHAAFLAIASVLTVQAFFFADGGLLALGCTIFNLGFFPCFVAYPLIYRRIAGSNPTTARLWTVSILAAVAGLELGALGVVLETRLSEISALPFTTFIALMLPIHLPIGIIEGIVTAAVVQFVYRARPEVFDAATALSQGRKIAVAPVLVVLAIAAVCSGGVLSWFASSHPDGLEWALFHSTGTEEFAGREDALHASLAHVQTKTAILPDYTFSASEAPAETGAKTQWPAVDPGTSVSGIVGGAITLGIVALAGLALRRRAAPARP
ncbi:MAG: energy-coupling factor ABC transporter permease [Candidatus Hydrogenedentes bacterium]|nr:energy-coupling factor ABC transporter permease [Candidatus Hydrogenedentota bacterium]